MGWRSLLFYIIVVYIGIIALLLWRSPLLVTDKVALACAVVCLLLASYSLGRAMSDAKRSDLGEKLSKF